MTEQRPLVVSSSGPAGHCFVISSSLAQMLGENLLAKFKQTPLAIAAMRALKGECKRALRFVSLRCCVRATFTSSDRYGLLAVSLAHVDYHRGSRTGSILYRSSLDAGLGRDTRARMGYLRASTGYQIARRTWVFS